MNDQTTPNVTPADVEACIASEHYTTGTDALVGQTRGPEWQATPAALDMLTICMLVTHAGHTVTGESHCQHPAKFNAQTGREEARKDAINKLWPMVVYAARSKLAGS
jgi:hypothetical protein